MITLEELSSRLHALASDVEEIKRDGRRGDLATCLVLGQLLGKLTLEEARHLARRGVQSPSLEEAPAVVSMVEELEVDRWSE